MLAKVIELLVFVVASFPTPRKGCMSSSNTVRPRSLGMGMLLFSNIHANNIGIVPELFLPGALFFEDDAVGLPHWLCFEETVHGLERNRLGFGDEEEDEEDGKDHHGGEEEVDAAARWTHVVEHLGSEAGDDEVLTVVLVT